MPFLASRRATLGLLGATALTHGTPALTRSARKPFEPAAIAWLRRNAQPLPSADPPPQLLKPLVTVLNGGEVIGIGEATHGSHEDFAFKAALIRALIVHGDLRVVALECNRLPGLLFDRYVSGQSGDPIDILRSGGFFQVWQSEEFTGLISWIRAWNASGRPKVRVIGVDCQALGPDTLHALNWLEKNKRGAASELRARLAPLIRDRRLREGRTLELVRTLDAAQWQVVRAALEDLAAAIGEPTPGDSDHQDAAHAAVAAKQALLSSEDFTTFATEAQKQDPEVYMRRDRFMAENLLSLTGGARTAYWAHNLHVIQNDVRAGGPTTTGGHLRRRLGRRYRIVIFEYDSGRIHAKPASRSNPFPTRETPWQVFERPPRRDRLAHVLASVGPEKFWVHLHASQSRPPAKWLAHDYPNNWAADTLDESWAPFRHALKDVDVLVFFRKVTPSRLYPFVPQR